MKEEERYHHHPHLGRVATQDVEFLLERDRAYGASWKEAGGRSAWFMLRRKMDRLVQIMRRPESPIGFDPEKIRDSVVFEHDDVAHLVDSYYAENIFAMVRRRPGGEDGSALAEIRDLRRYLLLVEAEMVARGVLEMNVVSSAPMPTAEPETKAYDPPSLIATGGGLASVAAKDSFAERCVPRFAAPQRLEDGLTSRADLPPGVPYFELEDPMSSTAYFLVERTALRPDEIDNLPRLQNELNHQEYVELLPEYRGLYRPFNEASNKYLMREKFRALWGKEP